MIRFVWIAALACVLCLVLYIPSAVPPERLMQTVRAEHDLNTSLCITYRSPTTPC